MNFFSIFGFTGMPKGHPFQGGQPSHLESTKHSFSLPKRPYLSSKQQPKIVPAKVDNYDEFDTAKMMRYDDFTDENVGNIIMDEEPLPVIERGANIIEDLKSVRNHEGIDEFDEVPYFRNTPSSYKAAGNRQKQLLAKLNSGQGGGRPGYRPYQRGPPRIIGNLHIYQIGNLS